MGFKTHSRRVNFLRRNESMNMKEKLQEIREEAVKRIQGSEGLEQLNEVRVAYLGKKGQLTAVLKGMKDVAAEERQIGRASSRERV